MSLLNLFVAVFLSHFLSLYSFERTRMAHLTALTSLVHHIFGQHQHCSDFCRAKIQPPQHTQTDSTSCMSSCRPGIEETLPKSYKITRVQDSSVMPHHNSVHAKNHDYKGCTLYLHQILFLYEESRYGTSIDYQNVEKHIIKDVTLLLSKIADKSDRLINNSTTNLAESWMHIRHT
jgi:hypothetical protein